LTVVVLLSLKVTWFTCPWNGSYEFYTGTERAFSTPWDGGLEMRRAAPFVPALTCIFMVTGVTSLGGPLDVLSDIALGAFASTPKMNVCTEPCGKVEFPHDLTKGVAAQLPDRVRYKHLL
jgi:hypothetical protein